MIPVADGEEPALLYLDTRFSKLSPPALAAERYQLLCGMLAIAIEGERQKIRRRNLQREVSRSRSKLIEKGPEATRESIAAARVWSNGIMRDLRQASIEGMNELFGEADDAGTPGTAEGEAAPANQ